MFFRRKKTNSQQFSPDKMELPGDMQDTLEPLNEIEKARRDIMLACLEAARREQVDQPEKFPHATDQPPPEQTQPRETQSRPTEPRDNDASVEPEPEQNPPDLTEDIKTTEHVDLTEQTSQPAANGLADLTNQMPPPNPPPTCTIPADQPTYRNKSENIKDNKLIEEILNGIVTEDIARNHKPPAEPLCQY
jgi:hypothetical protein